MSDDIFEYSEAEKILIKGLSPHWANVIENQYIAPLNLYRILAQDCFLDNRNDKYADALRRGYKALLSSSVYRMTPEFDELIKV